MNLNKLQQKIQEFLKDNDLDKLKDNYREPTTNDDFVEYKTLTQNYINSLDDSIKESEEV